MKEDIGSLIKLAREQRNTSLRGLSKRCGISASSICRFESNKDIPSQRSLKKLARSLRVKADVYMDWLEAIENAVVDKWYERKGRLHQGDRR